MSLNKGDVIKPAKAMATNKSSASGKGQAPKRFASDMSPNVSAEEFTVISHQLEGLTDDIKNLRDDFKSVMKTNEMESFIEKTVKKILTDMNENMDVTISMKVDEKTKEIKNKMKSVEKENECLKKELVTVKSELTKTKTACSAAESQSKQALKIGNHNEQYSRKNNIKIMDVTQQDHESIEDLTTKVCDIVSEHGLSLDPQNIVAVHRIPGKINCTKPVLIKLKNNHEKTKIMRKRSDFKNNGHRLVDDVTKMNAQLIQTLMERDDVEQAWFFNGSVFAKGKGTEKRHKVELFDDIDKALKN